MESAKEIIPGTALLPYVYLKPGELYVAWEPTLVTTLLGSCVSIIFYLPDSKVSAICHSMLPYQGINHADTPFRYVDSSIDYMLDAIKAKHLRKSCIKAKLFGGANVTVKMPSGKSVHEGIGQQNIEAAKEILSQQGIRVVGEKVGGKTGYKLFFRSDTGQVALRHIANTRGFEQ